MAAASNLNLADYLLEARLQEGKGERIALRLDSRNWTYREVQQLAHAFGHTLRQLGVRQEERVIIALPDGPDFVGCLFGVLKIGAVVVMVNPDLPPGDLAGLLTYTRARIVVVDLDHLASFSAAAALSQWPGRVLIADSAAATADLGANPCVFPRASALAMGALETTPTHPDDAAIWLFSGGTTGLPKAVVQTHASFVNTTERYAKATLGYCETDITLSVPKLYFGYATGSNLFFPFAVGASAVLFPEHPTAEILFAKISRHRPTILIHVPTMIHRMVNHRDVSMQDLSCLRLATSAGEALPVALYESWKARFGVELLDGLGTAEMWHIFITNRPGDVRPGTLGRVVSGFEIKVCDEDGGEVQAGEVGRLWVRGNSRAISYWQNQAKSQEAFRGEWFVGGDLVAKDEDGYVTYCGRADDVLKVGGKWFIPQELENCLLRHPQVKECAVVGAPDEQGLTKPFAFVIAAAAAPGLAAELKEFALQELQPYKHPRRVFVVDDLPRTHLGKVDRGKLKQLVELS